MSKVIRLAAAFGLAVLLGACVSGNQYDPEAKFANMRPAQPMKITGSRISRMVSPDERNPETFSPVSVMTNSDIANSGEVHLGDYLRKKVPNMVRGCRSDSC